MRLAISIGISPRQSLNSWASLAHELERAGVGRLWLIDSQLAMKDVYAGLLLAAQKTERMELGTGVTNPLTRHPTVTACSIAAVAEVSGGRALLGIGAGDSAVYGIGQRPARVAQVEASLSFFRGVLASGAGEWAGHRYTLPHLSARVPVWLAASQHRMCALAGRLADGVILMGPAEVSHVTRQVGWVLEGLHQSGRQRREIEISLITTVSSKPDRQAALADVRSWASAQARLIADFAELPAGLDGFRNEIQQAKKSYDFSRHLSRHAGHQSAVSDGLTAALAVAGNPAECAFRLRELGATGVDGFIFPLLGGGRLERLKKLSEEVLARL
ncbi:MAG: LLM class flavin-dependent oxidoreductase [Candidatus Dormibacteraeota bacterium]|uniref:LLM class flavin-dependent oxidoreductase n=1 Tax=Candidatus Dormiibacter inghamiae TaxID=3127013 RepID=A0A934N8E9_9BACT|nr:LLM class flavin-dependent oxidoreductase [Candidatus Dormibacteraeota bacterium]MBJ7605133.1 LLM class flavin-dependent oxidoreductase [Candidatus Dormibacteraeota bacterium]